MISSWPEVRSRKGYLRKDKNLFIYDPTVVKWRDEQKGAHRRFDSRRADFDESRLSEEYDPSYVAEETREV